MPYRHNEERPRPNLFGFFMVFILVNIVLFNGKRKTHNRSRHFQKVSNQSLNISEKEQMFMIPPHSKLVCDFTNTLLPNESLEKESKSYFLPEMVYGSTIVKPYNSYKKLNLCEVNEENYSIRINT